VDFRDLKQDVAGRSGVLANVYKVRLIGSPRMPSSSIPSNCQQSLAPAMMALPTVGLVHDLTDNTFRSFVAENDMVLVGFVLPFLPNYQRFSREFEEVYIEAVCGNAREADYGAMHRQLEQRVTLEFNSQGLTAKQRPRCAENLSSGAGQQ
jgi:hypothetical protein